MIRLDRFSLAPALVARTVLATTLLALAAPPLWAGGEPAGGAPQFLPVTARWCLKTAGQVGPCIGLEQPKGSRQYAIGLQHRAPLPPLRGMWFAYDPPALARFWMHQTPASLDMLFVAEGRVIAIEAAVPPCPRLPCRSYGPDTPVQGVLELAAGEAARLGITPGTVVEIEPLPPAGRPSP